MNVGTTPVTIGRFPCLIQNLGPDLLSVGQEGIDTGEWVEVASTHSVSIGATSINTQVVSAGTSDVRILGSGTGISI